MEQFLIFLSDRCHTLELTEKTTSRLEASKLAPAKRFNEKRVALTSTTPETCTFCSGSHSLYRCPEFLNLSSEKRWLEVKQRQICTNCLRKGHFARDCAGSACRKCSKKHNTLLHSERQQGQEKGQKKATEQQAASSGEASRKIEVPGTYHTHKLASHVILSTARLLVYDKDGKPHECRALLDPGSQSHLITKRLAEKLQIPSKHINLPIGGVSMTSTTVSETVQVKMKSKQNSFTAALDCLILPAITSKLPQVRISTANLDIPNDIRLADPSYDVPGEIDLLLGAGLFWTILCVGRINLARNQPILQKTLLGWVVGGEYIDSNNRKTVTSCNLAITENLEAQVERFWKTEEAEIKQYMSKQDEECEKFFKESVKREPSGRFVVSLPQDETVSLGDSKESALQRLYSLERRLKKQPALKKAYEEFLDDYEAMGHMTAALVEPERKEPERKEIYYLPHQAVVKDNSLTTRLRVVFDASAKTSNGVSLNDRLLSGPNIQEDLFNIIIRFRSHRYVITADIAKMFRQVMVAEADRDLQKILWRTDPTQPVRIFNLNTITYGTKCAPYLAIRCLKQLAAEEGDDFPLAAPALRQDFYMDDVLTGADTPADAQRLQTELSQLLKRGGFLLRKWRANDINILSHLSEDHKTEELMVLDKQEAVSTLGLLWNSATDTLQYNVSISDGYKVTKRSILSRIAQIYDPLGLIGPILVNAKLIMQQLWQLQTEWDESVPQSTFTLWVTYYNSLPKLNELRIPRYATPREGYQRMDLHGFADASEKAYGACVYAVVYEDDGIGSSILICSKSRVAPLKTVSLPRLELCAAVLLAKLATIVKRALKDKVSEIHLWSDSSITISWIHTSPHLLKTYVANRVSEIQTLTEGIEWHHVRSSENPADILSRGIAVEALAENQLWWVGPEWITQKDNWPTPLVGTIKELPELKQTLLVTNTTEPLEVLTKFSRFGKLQRVIAYCRRFTSNTKGNRKIGPLAVDELQGAEECILRMVQNKEFGQEFKSLKRDNSVDSKSCLAMLKPFVDEKGLIRVGGRLQQAEISVDQKHPIVLPSKHEVTRLIIEQEHEKLLHCGAEQLLSSLRQRYWPLSGRREVRKVLRRCVRCFRYRPKPPNAIMADLPKARLVQSQRPFYNCGVDYAGPFQLRESKRRGRIHLAKAYIAVFTCFNTKAVHLELVSDLTTDAFLAAFRRFAARRGTCGHMHSDNATNFVGAARELRELYAFMQENEREISEKLATQKVVWHFIPPRSPHFGGLWEAAVKSVKRHLTIMTRGLKFTFEEYYTLLTEIEATLNSRPLTQISSDPNDLLALTPSHFLTGDLLLQPPQQLYLETPDNHLSRWQQIQKIRQHFWNRWRKEYLHHLQTRSKWQSGDANIKIGQLVLLIDENSPPMYWPMGRVVEVHPGADNVVRVVSVKTASGNFKRALKKICALPFDS